MKHFDVLIVGAGHGGAQAAIALRQGTFAGSIAIVGEEPDLPYERPPLSKEYLAGDKGFERILIRPPAFWQDRQVTMLPGRHVVAVNPAAHHVITAEGESIGYDLRLQTIGLSMEYDQVVVRGDPGARSFSVVHLKRRRVIALDCVNATKDYVQGRKLVETGAMIEPGLLADASVPLKEML